MPQCRTKPADRRIFGPRAAALLLTGMVFCAVSGCSTTDFDKIPKELGGLPENAPRRAETPPPYPAVNEMPPPRSNALLDVEEQKRLEADLVATRNRLKGQQKAPAKDAPKQAAADPKARPAAKRSRPQTRDGSAAGSQAAPAAASANPPGGTGAPPWPSPPKP